RALSHTNRTATVMAAVCAPVFIRLEGEAQRHLDLPRAADGLVGDAQTARSWTLVQGCVGGVARSRRCWLSKNVGKAVVVDVLADVVDRDIEARSVGQVVDLEHVLQRVPLRELGCLDERDVSAVLPRLPEDVALAMVDEVGLVGVVGRNRAIQCAWGEQKKAKTVGVERGDASVHT